MLWEDDEVVVASVVAESEGALIASVDQCSGEKRSIIGNDLI